MNDQSVQPTQIPQEIRSFLENIIIEANLTSLDESQHEEMMQQMFSRLDQLLTTTIIENLPEDKLEEFVKMNEDQKPREEIEAYLRQHIPDVATIMGNTFSEFRDMYLGSVEVSSNTPPTNNTGTSTN